mgnify:CR=1 FL=1
MENLVGIEVKLETRVHLSFFLNLGFLGDDWFIGWFCGAAVANSDDLELSFHEIILYYIKGNIDVVLNE